MAKNNPASPRVVRRGTARPAESRFIRPPLRPNTEILPQSAGPDNPESRSGAYRGTRTIAIPPCRRAFFFYQNTQNPASPDTEGGWEKMPPPPRCFNHNPVTGDALRRVHVHSSHKSGIGPTRDVPAPPSVRGVRTREVATCYDRPGDRPTPKQARPQHEEYPRLRPVNTEPRGDTGTRRLFRVGLRTSQSRRL